MHSFLFLTIVALATICSALPTISLSTELSSLIDELSQSQGIAAVSSLKQAVSTNKNAIDAIFMSRSPYAGGSPVKSNTQAACNITNLVFGSNMYIDAQKPQYVEDINENWSKNCWLPAACIVQPSTAVEVSVALKIITLLGTQFSVRSGGHNPNPGFGSSDGGVLLDLANVNYLQISNDTKIVAAGPGNRWSAVYSYLDQFSISAVGGRHPDVGLGGFFLGGGMPYIPNLYGFGCDNLESVEIVLADSSIITASSTENSDLFQALKGGGPNYGIVTRYNIRTVPLHNVWYHLMLFNQSQNPELFNATVATQAAMEHDPNAGLIFNADGPQTLVGFIYAGFSNKPAVFSAFDGIPIAAEFAPPANGTISSLSKFLGSVSGLNNSTHIPTTMAHIPSFDLYNSTYQRFLSISNFTGSGTSDMSYAIQPIGSAAVLAGRARGGNSLGLTATSQNWFNSVAEFTVSSSDAAAKNAIATIKSIMTEEAKQRGLLLDFQFMNDAHWPLDNPLASYGAESLDRMRRAARKYDPGRVFQQLQGGGFKVDEA